MEIFNNDTSLEFGELEFRDKVYYKDKLFTGIAYELRDDNIKVEGTWKDGLQNGEANTYSNENRIKCSILVNGKFNGLQKEWYEDGQLKSERLMKDGVIDNGLQKEWYENGQLKSERLMKDGVIVGKQISYHENGELKKESVFLEGNHYNDIREFDSGGNIINVEKCVFLNKEFKKEISNYSVNEITNVFVDISLIKSCAYEAMEFRGEFKGHNYTVYGKDSGKWCETEYEGEHNIEDFIENIEDAEIHKLDNYLDFTFSPIDSYGFFGDKIIWEDNTPNNIKEEIKDDDPEYANLISECLDSGDYDSDGIELYEPLNNILNIEVSFKYNKSKICIKWYNQKIINELKNR